MIERYQKKTMIEEEEIVRRVTLGNQNALIEKEYCIRRASANSPGMQ